MNIVPPVHDGSRLLISSFYNGSMMLALDDDRPEAELVWKGRSDNEIATPGLHSVMTTPVIRGDYVYGVGSFGQLRALNAATGARLWETQDLIGERARWASAFIVAHEDRFFINNDRGDLIIAKLSPSGYEEISRARLITPTSNSSNRRRLGGVNWVAAAYANLHVVIRNDHEVLHASLAAADYPTVPAFPSPVRRTTVSRPDATVTPEHGQPPLTIQFAANGTVAGDVSTFQFGEFYLLSGRGVNTPLFILDDGVMAMDPFRSGSFEEVRTEVTRITDKPITTIVTTRAYTPDSERLGEYPNLVDVVAHANTATAVGRMDLPTSDRARFTPTRIYERELTLNEDHNQVVLYHVGVGPTDGDSVVVVPRFNMAYLGDLFPSKGVPIIESELGGDASALPDTLTRVAEILEETGVTFVLPGRASPPTPQTLLGWFTVDDVREYASFCRDLFTAVRDALRAGYSIDETVANLELPEKYRGYNLNHARSYVQTVVAELR